MKRHAEEKPEKAPEKPVTTLEETSTKKVRPARRFWRVFFLTTVAVCFLLLGSFTAYAFYSKDRILPHTEIAGVEVGELTLSQANAKIQTKEDAFGQSTLNLSYAAKSWQLPASTLAPQFSNDVALNAAYATGKTGSISHQLAQLFTSLFQHQSFDVTLAPLTATANENFSKTVLASIESQPTETTLQLTPGNVQVKPGIAGQELDHTDFANNLYASFKTGNSAISLSLVPFQPLVTPAEAIPAQTLAQSILSSNWTIQASATQQLVFTPQQIAPWLIVSVAKDATGVATGLSLKLDTVAVDKLLETFASQVNVAPRNATLATSSSGLAITIPDQAGLTLQVDQTFNAISAAMLSSTSNHTVPALVVIAQASIRADSLTSLGITQLIGTGTTDFSGSPSNRVANITQGMKDINGRLIEDGQEFSTITALGPIDQAHGFVPGLVIIGNTTIPQDGGGLCQVSTTLFRAVLNAGLPVTARTNHSYEVSYYQRGIGPGLDATIYDPNPDFKWKNDTGHPVYIEAYITGTKLTFNLYGTSDGRTAAIDGPHTLATYPSTGAPIYTNTNTLPVGKTQYIDPPVDGARTTATYTVTRNGQVINTQTFNSYYQPMPAQYLVGTGN